MKIQVTEDDIRNGTPRVGEACPIYLALCRQGIPARIVLNYYFYLEDTGDPVKLPPDAVDFICLFDSGKSVKPFEFEIPD